MAASGFTPIKIYASSTAAAVPSAGNLDNTNGAELAINIADGKLFYKDSGGTVQTIAYKNVPLSTVTGTLAIANGGTGQTTASASFNALSPITTTGDLIIGNGANSATRLAIGTNGYVLTSDGTTATWSPASSGSGDVVGPASATDNAIARFDGTTGKLIQNSSAFVDDSGNLGLGVTPSAWDTSIFRTVQIGTGAGSASISGRSDGAKDAIFGSNLYYATANFRYVGTGEATMYRQETGSHKWFTAASGTAGNAISFTQAMTLTASGNLGIGTNSPTVGLDVAGNIAGNNVNAAYTTTATAGGTTTLTAASTGIQYFTGTSNQTVQMPVTSTLALGWSYHIANTSTGVLTINSSGGNQIGTIPAGVTAMVTCILTTGTTAASWDLGLTDFPTATGTGSVVLATSPAITTPTLTDPTITGAITEDIFTITDGAAFEVDPGNGTIQLITLGANRTPKATNFAAGESVTLMVNDGTAYTITWTDATWGSGGVVWAGGVAPTLATTGYTVIEFWKVSTQVYGALVGSVA